MSVFIVHKNMTRNAIRADNIETAESIKAYLNLDTPLHQNSGVNTSVLKSFSAAGEAQSLPLTFDEAVDLSDCAVTAAFIGEHAYNNYSELEFHVNDILYGYVPDKSIMVFEMDDPDYDGYMYTKNEIYTLILERTESLFYDHPRYLIISGIYIPITDTTKEITMDNKPILDDGNRILNRNNISQYIKDKGRSILNSPIIHDNRDIPFTTADALPEIIDNSDYVMEISVKDMVVEGRIGNSNTYICSVINVLKGGFLDTHFIWISFLKEEVETGGTYTVMVNRLGRDSLIYVQSSKNSVVPADNIRVIEEINNYLAE